MDEIEERFKDLPLRTGVGIILLNKENKVFVAKRIDNPKNFWQMPQGGVDDGEDYLAAAYRELEEETSIKDVKLIQELEGSTTYILPKHILGIIWKGKYKGQKQKWFLMRHVNNDQEINIKMETTMKAWQANSILDTLEDYLEVPTTSEDLKEIDEILSEEL